VSLVTCRDCGNQIGKSATSCPQCGGKVRRTSLLTMIVAALFFVVILVAVLIPKKDLNQSTGSTAASASEQARLATMAPERRAQEEKKRREETTTEEERRLQRLGLRWNYLESQDKMGRGTIRNATVSSTNEIQFGFPYQGSQRATLQLRIHPKYRKDIILSIERGQFLCGLDRCVVTVRFDNGKAQTYSASEPADHSTTYLFLRNYDRFVAALRKSKESLHRSAVLSRSFTSLRVQH